MLKKHPDCPAVFIFDETFFAEYSLKRLTFIYESVLEIPNIEVRSGSFVPELLDAVSAHNADRILLRKSVHPAVNRIVAQLSNQHNITVATIQHPAFVEDAPYDLKRFSRYWRQAEKKL